MFKIALAIRSLLLQGHAQIEHPFYGIWSHVYLSPWQMINARGFAFSILFIFQTNSRPFRLDRLSLLKKIKITQAIFHLHQMQKYSQVKNINQNKYSRAPILGALESPASE